MCTHLHPVLGIVCYLIVVWVQQIQVEEGDLHIVLADGTRELRTPNARIALVWVCAPLPLVTANINKLVAIGAAEAICD